MTNKSRFIGVSITNLQQIVSIFELYRKLLGDNAPVRDRHRPFFAGITIRQVDEFDQGCIVRKDALVFSNLADLAMVAFHGYMNKPQIFAVIIITGTVLYFLNDVIKHAKARGGAAKQIIARTIIWLLIFGVTLGINLLINSAWVPGKWLFSISF